MKSSGQGPKVASSASRQDLELQNVQLRGIQNQLESSRDRYEDLYNTAPVGYITLTERGVVREINMMAASMLATEPAAAVGVPFLIWVRPEDAVPYFHFLRQCRARIGDVAKVEMTISLRDGSSFPVELVGRAHFLDSTWRLRTTMIDISDRRRAEEERTRSTRELARRIEAERANSIKDVFLAKLSHDLRTPLNSILTWTILLREGHLNEALVEKAIQTIERNTRLQVQLIEDLLDVSRIIAGKLAIDPAPVDMKSILATAVEDVQATADDKGIVLRVERETDVPLIIADASRLHQVFSNLLLNSIKYSPKSSTVTVRLALQSDRVSIAIMDQGVGIDPAFLPHIFDPFSQAEERAHLRSSGLGLGLAIVKQIVEMHRGRVEAFSEGTGCGATFIVSIPLVTGLKPKPAAAPASPKPDAFPAEPAPGPESATNGSDGSLATDVPLEGVKVLVVEDEDDARDWLVTAIERWGGIAVAASSARQALELLDSTAPDVLVSDIGLPDEDGYELIASVRGRESSPVRDVPALALTAFARTNERQRALAAGFQLHIAKPFEPHELRSAIADLAGR